MRVPSRRDRRVVGHGLRQAKVNATMEENRHGVWLVAFFGCLHDHPGALPVFKIFGSQACDLTTQ